MASTQNLLARLALAAAGGLSLAAYGQSTVTITGRSLGSADVTGFADTPLARSPLQAQVYGSEQLSDAGIASIGGLTRLNASLADAYNAEGYWSSLSARGYALDNRYNYLRDGLPINAETAIALDNKDRLELLEGTSGIQAGTSAPGGLVNLVVKRPTGTIRTARLEFRERGSVLGAVDIGGRLGPDDAIGLRLNAAAERLDPPTRHTEGHRTLLALAADWQLSPDTLLQAEIESSRQRQPSVVGFSMLGDTVPAARSIDPRINLNDQPWGQPVVMNGDTASLRWEQRLSEDWRFTAHAMQQQLKSDDRTAFPYGVYDTTAYDCPQWCDRYAQDGTFSYWQYVSDNERRTSQALSLVVAGQVRTAGIEHKVETGVLLSRYHGRFQDQVYDIAGTGRIDDSLQVPASPGGTDANTNRDERSTEFFLRDAIRLAPGWQLWAGLRHTRLDREAERTSTSADGGLRRTRYAQGLSTPWLAISNELSARTLVYASWGQGVESEVVPNRDRYTNRTTVLPALKSRQIEAGLKHRGEVLEATLAVFDTDRPQAADIGACSAADSCTRAIDGSARHRGVEASGSWRAAAWLWHFGTLWMDAQRRGSSQPGIDGTRPVNVPAATWRLSVEYAVPSVPGLGLLADASAESNRVVLPYDQSVKIPGWQRLDLGARWRHTLEGTTLVWRLGLDNATDQRAWKESPYQFGHVYLYPLAPRTWRASLQASF